MEGAIGVFDSGVGGLTVAREIIRNLPAENVIYFGDTARVPYGSKSKDTVLRYSRQIVRFLLSKKVKAIVVACNTASALALEEMREEIPVPIIGVVKPGARMAVSMTKTKSIGIIGTDATVKSRIYSSYIRELDPEVRVVEKACPLFCPLVEEGLLEDRVTEDMVERYLSELKPYGIDALVLGCTHYPLLTNPIKRFMGDEVTLVNPAFETARSLREMLDEKGLLADNTVEPNYEFYVSDGIDKFKIFADKVLPVNVDKVEIVNIESY